MHKLVISIGLFAAVMSPTSAWAERTPEVLAQTGKWDLVYDEKGCDLSAAFGEGKDAVVAKFTLFSPRGGSSTTLYGERFRTRSAVVPATMGFGEPLISYDALGIFGMTGTKPTLTLRRRGRGTGDAPPRQFNSLTFAFEGKRPVRLAFSNYEAAMDALGRCADNVVKEWGYDPAQQAAIVQAPKPLVPVADWLKSRDYPNELLRGGHSGIVSFRLDINEQGGVSSCVIVSASSQERFADVTCQLISERAKFSPAQDANGKAIRSYYVGAANWLP